MNGGSAVRDFMSLRYPSIHFVELKGTEDGLVGLVNNDLDVVVAESFQASYYISKLKLTGLTIETSYTVDFLVNLSFGAREDFPELILILNKILESMPKEDVLRIESRWISLQDKEGLSKEVTNFILVGSIVMVGSLVMIVLWNQSLNRVVDLKTKELTQANSLLNSKMEELKEKTSEIKANKEEIFALYEQMKALNDELLEAIDKVHRGYRQTALSLANAIEAKDKYTKGHCERVASHAVKLGALIGLSQSEIDELEFASLLHDIGKIGVESSILNKKGSLSDEEFSLIKSHPTIGYEILKDTEFMHKISTYILQHHEHYDGTGYPSGLSGSNITIQARIIAIADAFDAMTSNRPYRSRMSEVEAFNELIRARGKQFDPLLVDRFVERKTND